MYRRLLVPLDGSELAEEALPHALGLAGRLGSEVILLRVVVSPYALVAPDLVLAGSDPNLPALNHQAQQYLDSVAARFPKDIPFRGIVCEGPVAEAIIDHAATLDADLIIMSTHGRGGVSRWVYGSVAERVLQGSSCPILLIRSMATRS